MKYGLAPPEGIHTAAELEAWLEAAEAYFRKLDTPKLGGPRRHHYIPEFYLKRFAQNRKRLVRIQLPVPPSHSRKATNITKLAVIKDFYTARTEKGESAFIENVLGVWDSDASECIRKLTDRDVWPISQNLKLRMCFWFALLKVRSPHQRRQGEAILDFGAAIIGDGTSDKATAADPASSWVHQNEMIRSMLYIAGELFEHFAARRWQVLHFDSKDGLLLADTGSVLVPGPSSHFGTGMANAAEILIPLGRHHLLCMHSFEGLDEQVVELDSDASSYLLRHYNNMFVSSAYQEIFCHPDDFDPVLQLAKQCHSHPLMNVQGGTGENLKVDGVNAPPKRRGPHRYRPGGAHEKHTGTGSVQRTEGA